MTHDVGGVSCIDITHSRIAANGQLFNCCMVNKVIIFKNKHTFYIKIISS